LGFVSTRQGSLRAGWAIPLGGAWLQAHDQKL